MGIIILLLPLVLIFFMMQNQRKKAAAQNQLLASLTEGDDVVTTAGLYGTLTWVGQEEAFIEIADGVEIHLLKGAIARKVDMHTTEAARVSESGEAVEALETPDAGQDVVTPDLVPPADNGPVADTSTTLPPAGEPKRRRLGGAK